MRFSKRSKRVLLGLVVVASVVGACGGGDAADVRAARTVDVSMVDIEFAPDTISAETGETIRFRFTNNGEADHDAFVGDREAQADQEDKVGGSAHDNHSDDDGLSLEPGQTGELTHTFDEAGTFEIGCHQPGHYEAGMKITVEVS